MKVHQRVSNRDRRQAATSGRKAYPGDKFPTAQSSGPPRDRAKKGLEICTPEMWELTAPGRGEMGLLDPQAVLGGGPR